MATPQNIRYILYSPHLSIPHHLPTLSPTHPLLPHIFSFYFPHPLFSHPTYFPYSPLPSPIYLYTFPTPSSHFSSPFLTSSIIASYNVHVPLTLPYLYNCPHHPIHALVTSLYSFIPSSARSHIPHLLFHVKHINNNSYFYFHIIYYIILYYMYLCPLHIVSTCLLSSTMNYESLFTIYNHKI